MEHEDLLQVEDIHPTHTNVMEQIVIATLGNSTDFGDLQQVVEFILWWMFK